jgi:L,D-transpeptidase ErfK/SrfK
MLIADRVSQSILLGLLGLLLCGSPARADSAAPGPALDDVRKTVGRNLLHTVQPGESIFTIARKYGLAVEHVAFANGFAPSAIEIEPGVTLIIPKQRILPAHPPRDGIVLNLPERGLYLFRNGQFDRFVAVSIGDEKGFSTPTGQYRIIERIKDPVWYPPAWAKDRRPVGPGPDNPLGKHWIGLSLPRTGIHGTNQPINIGNSVTHGCIRAYPEAVARLFNDVKVGWPVRIEYETVKMGRDPEGRLKIVTFPDVYQRQSPLDAVRHRLGPAAAQRLGPLVRLDLGIAMQVERHGALLEEVREDAQARPRT